MVTLPRRGPPLQDHGDWLNADWISHEYKRDSELNCVANGKNRFFWIAFQGSNSVELTESMFPWQFGEEAA